MAVPVLESTAFTAAAASSVAVPNPSGTASSDYVALMLLSVGTSAQSHASFAGGSFTQVGSTYQRNVGGGNNIGLSWWVSNTDVSGASTWTFAPTGGTVGQCGGLSYRVSGSAGLDSTAGRGLVDSFITAGNTGALPSINTTVADCLAIAGVTSSGLTSGPSGWSLDATSTSNGVTTHRYDKDMPSAAATGTNTVTVSTNGITGRGVLSFLPASSTAVAATPTEIVWEAAIGNVGGQADVAASPTEIVWEAAIGNIVVGGAAAIAATPTIIVWEAAIGNPAGTAQVAATPTTIVWQAGTGNISGGVGTPPDTPTEVRPTSAFGYDGDVELSWVVPDDNGSTITGYIVHVSTDDGDTWTPHATPSSEPATITGLTIGQRYTFRVAAVNSGGTGAFGVSEWGSTPIYDAAPITPPTPTTRDASHAGRWGLDVIDGTEDDDATSTWTGNGVRVYVVDAMIRNTHNEFASQSFAVHYAIDGIDYNDYTSTADHGTLVSGVAVGATCGVAYDAELIFISCSTADIVTPFFNFVEPFEWIYANHPANTPGIIITAQLWGDDGGDSDYQDTDGRQTSEWFPLLDALVTDLIEDKGLAFVQCVGNTTSPDHFDLPGRPGLVLVGGSTSAGNYSSSSELGSHVTIIAPGVSILTSDVGSNSELTLQTGTSFSAPMVGGAMACWLEANPHLTPRQLVDILLAESVKDSLGGTSGGAPNRFLYSLADIAVTESVEGSPTVISWDAATGSITATAGITATATFIEWTAPVGDAVPTSQIAASPTVISWTAGTGNITATAGVAASPTVIEWTAAVGNITATAQVAATATFISWTAGAGSVAPTTEASPSVIEWTAGIGNVTATAGVVASPTVIEWSAGIGNITATAQVAASPTIISWTAGIGSVAPTAAVAATPSVIGWTAGTGNITATAQVAAAATIIEWSAGTGSVAPSTEVHGLASVIAWEAGTGNTTSPVVVSGVATTISWAAGIGNVTGEQSVAGTPTLISWTAGAGDVTATASIDATPTIIEWTAGTGGINEVTSIIASMSVSFAAPLMTVAVV